MRLEDKSSNTGRSVGSQPKQVWTTASNLCLILQGSAHLEQAYLGEHAGNTCPCAPELLSDFETLDIKKKGLLHFKDPFSMEISHTAFVHRGDRDCVIYVDICACARLHVCMCVCEHV